MLINSDVVDRWISISYDSETFQQIVECVENIERCVFDWEGNSVQNGYVDFLLTLKDVNGNCLDRSLMINGFEWVLFDVDFLLDDDFLSEVNPWLDVKTVKLTYIGSGKLLVVKLQKEQNVF